LAPPQEMLDNVATDEAGAADDEASVRIGLNLYIHLFNRPAPKLL
jgi:hypothetical protein